MIKLKTKSIESSGLHFVQRSDPQKRAIIDSELLKLKALKLHQSQLKDGKKRQTVTYTAKSETKQQSKKNGKIKIIDNLNDEISKQLEEATSSINDSISSASEPSPISPGESPKRSVIFKQKPKKIVYPAGGIQGDLMRVSMAQA